MYDVPADSGTGRENLGNEPRRERAGFATSAEFRIPTATSRRTTTPIHAYALWPALRVRAGESARDVAWLPTMRAHDTRTCLFASACKSQPAPVGRGRAVRAVRRKNHLDEPRILTRVFADGSRVFAGAGSGAIRSRPRAAGATIARARDGLSRTRARARARARAAQRVGRAHNVVVAPRRGGDDGVRAGVGRDGRVAAAGAVGGSSVCSTRTRARR